MSDPKPAPAREELDGMAGEAWDAFSALVRAENADPALRENRYFRALKDTAHARFRAVFEASA